jgi:hypothetical protein
MQFTADSGFDDADWVKREEKERQETVFSEDQDERPELDLSIFRFWRSRNLSLVGEAVMLISASASRTMAPSTFRLPRLRRKFALA